MEPLSIISVIFQLASAAPKIDNFLMRDEKKIYTSGQRNELFEDLLKKEFNSFLIDGLHVKELKKLDHSIIKEIIRLSIRDQGVALPNKKVTDEIIKTFISSNPGPKSKVLWSRADKDLPSGEITYNLGA